jgi:hypothetical protein
MKEILHSLAHKLHNNEFEVLTVSVKLNLVWWGGVRAASRQGTSSGANYKAFVRLIYI